MRYGKLKINKLIFIIPGIILIMCQCKVDYNNSLGQENAVWTEAVYFRGHHVNNNLELTDNEVISLAQNLKKYNIKYAYIFAGPFDNEGNLPDFAFSETAGNSIRMLHQYYPELIVLPWVGGIQNKTVYLEDSTWVNNALQASKKLIETLSVPGLHFDFEFLLKGDPFLERTEVEGGSGDVLSYGKNVNEFHRKFRLLMPDVFVSSVVVSTSPDTKPWKRKTSFEELEELVRYVDQLSFLYYDTFLDTQKEFTKNCLFLLKDIQELKRISYPENVQFLVSIGTFTNAPELQKYRNMKIENIPNTLKTIKSCAKTVSEEDQIVDGISIYCNWQTDEYEWQQIYENWTKQDDL